MARNTVTEESLGIAPTDEEVISSPEPVQQVQDDDISLADDTHETQAPETRAKETDEPPEAAPAPKDEQKTVDLRALQEARAEARESKRRADLLEQRWNEFLVAQRPKEPEKQPDPVPQFATDPLAAGEWTQKQLVEMQQRQQQEQREAAERQQQDAAYQQTFQRVNQDYIEAMQTDPGVKTAYDTYRESVGKELLALGYTIPQAQQELNRIERQHVEYVAQNGRNIAEHIKALAATRGWQPPAPAAQQARAADPSAIAAAQQRHQSLSDAAGGEAPAPIDAKALGRMSDKEFASWMSKKGNEDKFDQMMGSS